jgi:hypothetical protein
MKPSPSRRKPERAVVAVELRSIRPPARTVALRSAADHRRALLDVDFAGPRERVVRAALTARIERPGAELLDEITVADRHWLIAHLLCRDVGPAVDIADRCSVCSEMLALSLDLAAAIRHAEPAVQRGVILDGVRAPTSNDIESASTLEELIVRCAPHHDGPLGEIEQALGDADPLGVITLNTTCVVCGAPSAVEVDLEARWLASSRQTALSLLEEVHMLARYYHWTEDEILGLSDTRRNQYIELCRSEAQIAEQEAYV